MTMRGCSFRHCWTALRKEKVTGKEAKGQRQEK